MNNPQQVDSYRITDIIELQDILGASRGKVDRLVKTGVIPVHSTKTFYKWGKSLEARRFDRGVVEEIARKLARQKPQKGKVSPPRVDATLRLESLMRGASFNSTVRRSVDLEQATAFYSLSGTLTSGVFVKPSKKQATAKQKQRVNENPAAKPLFTVDYCFRVPLPKGLHERLHEQKPILGAERIAWIKKLRYQIETESKRFAKAAEKVFKRWEKETLKHLKSNEQIELDDFLSGWERVAHYHNTSREPLFFGVPTYQKSVSKGFTEELVARFEERLHLKILQPIVSSHLEKSHSLSIASEQIKRLGDGYYPSLFPLARTKKRRLIAYLGPTNSGKTHQALEMLRKAMTGCYLAPLRLMALENADRLNEAGIPCDMVTGEERLLQEGARHVSATIEMMDISRDVEVAIIDEIQMLTDRDRGWAWTQALIGTPADTLIMTGSPDALPMIRQIAGILGEKVEVVRCERLTSLEVSKPASLAELEAGDAIIAFSRQEIFQLRIAVQARGRSVAVIYGNLSPEVRRSEAERFRNGEADILIATDAIGMGLNLPIRRVLFSDIEKFDGISRRELLDTEIRQIGGRAGRYGLHDGGRVSMLRYKEHVSHKLGVKRLREGLESAIGWEENDNAKAVGQPFLMPPLDMILDISSRLQTSSIQKIFSFINKRVLQNDKSGYLAVKSDDLGKLLNTIDRDALSLTDRYRYLGCPFPLGSEHTHSHLSHWIRSHCREEAVSLPNYKQLLGGKATDIHLLKCEVAIKELSAYLWLSEKFPHIYSDVETAREQKARLNQVVEGLLQKKALERVCKECGNSLGKKHRFPICDPCYRSRRRYDYWW